MSKWDKMDRMVWNKSEVMKEFEKQVLDAMNKNAQANVSSKKLDNMNKSIKQTNENLSKLKTNLISLSDDETEDKEEDTESCVCSVKIELEDLKKDCGCVGVGLESIEELFENDNDAYMEAKASLISELIMIKDAALNDSDIVTVYKIERKIAELEEE